MVEVRIRHDLEETATHLTDMPLDKVGDVIREIQGWGVRGDPEEDPDTWPTLTGQFVVWDGEAYFEVLIHD